MPFATALVHSLVLGDVLVAKEVVEMASRRGLGAGTSLGGGLVGFMSGD